MSEAACPVTFTGPLQPYTDGLRLSLLELGYTPLSAHQLLRVAAHLSRWLTRRSLPLSALTPDVAAAFLRCRRRAGRRQFLSPRCLQPILTFLSGAGALPATEKAAHQKNPVDVLIGRYVEYLEQERGLAASTIQCRERIARWFLRVHSAVKRVTATQVTRFILLESKRYASGSTKVYCTALRSFLRYLYVSGQTKIDLGGAVPAIPAWRLAELPKAIAREDVDRILQSCDRRTTMGRRDFAVLLLLTRLGLRAGEVRALLLDDIRWAEGVITIRGKGSINSEVPLPVDVGRALVEYLRVRGRRPSRSVFLRARAPYRAMGLTTVTQIVLRASKRAGLEPVHAHRLRHSVATEMLRRGGSLTEIAHALRHRDLDTTAIYAKVDTNRLRAIARPWPGGPP